MTENSHLPSLFLHTHPPNHPHYTVLILYPQISSLWRGCNRTLKSVGSRVCIFIFVLLCGLGVPIFPSWSRRSPKLSPVKEGKDLWTESWSKSERKVFFRKTPSDDYFERLSGNPQQICMLIGIIYSKQGSKKIALHNNRSLIWLLQFGSRYWVKGKAKLLEVLQDGKQSGNRK